MYRVRTAITGGTGGPSLSTMYFSVIGGLTAQHAVAATGAFWTALRSGIRTGVVMTTEAEVATVDIATGLVTGLVPTTPVVVNGSSSAVALPWATQGLVRWRTGTFVGGREVRGRTFIPGMTTDNNAAGEPFSSWIGQANVAAAALIADANSDFMIYSRKNFDAVPAITGTHWAEWAVLRSRRQ